MRGLFGRQAELKAIFSALGGGLPVEIIGRPGIGKTAFVLNMAVNVAKPRRVALSPPDDPYAEATVEEVEAALKGTPGLAGWVTIGGISLLDSSTTLANGAVMYLVFTPFAERDNAAFSPKASVRAPDAA